MITSCRLSRSPNLLLAGSLVIMANLNENVMAPTEMIAKCSADQGGITLRSGPMVKKGARSAFTADVGQPRRSSKDVEEDRLTALN